MSDDTLTKRLLGDPARRPRILDDCVRLIDEEVGSKGGLSGLAIKGGYKIVCAVKPGVIREAMDHLLDDFVGRLDPFWQAHNVDGAAPSGFGDSLRKRAPEVADALLGITDDRARRAKNATMKSAYEKLRPQAKKHVEEAIPRVGRTLSAYL
ncbi:MAG: hypothetical protein IT383_07650 [Deltaproteobacteria bacterium]|nr:hypothetical protein [Deltaproteobacteria bacterium]